MSGIDTHKCLLIRLDSLKNDLNENRVHVGDKLKLAEFCKLGRAMEICKKTKLEEDEEEDRLTLADFIRFRSCNTTPLSMVALDGIEENSCEKRVGDRYKTRAEVCGLSYNENARAHAEEQALEVGDNLDPHFPVFVKSLAPSQVSNRYWMGLPVHFCKTNLPKKSVTITLVDENQKEFPVIYNAERTMLQLGWKIFCDTHKLVAGDALVFHLVKPTEFKVYIIRAYKTPESDRVLGIQNTNACENCIGSSGKDADENGVTDIEDWQQPGHCRSKGKEVGPKVDGIRLMETTVKFKDVKNLESFTIVVNGLTFDSEFSEEQRSKYYELCCSQKSFLHDNLFDGLNCNLVSGVISQVISIADAIRASKISTFEDVFEKWDKNLESIQLLGMNVGLLRARIKELVGLESNNGVYSEKREKAMARKDRMIKKIRSLRKKILQLEEVCNRVATKIETLEVEETIENEEKFQAVVDAPW